MMIEHVRTASLQLKNEINTPNKIQDMLPLSLYADLVNVSLN